MERKKLMATTLIALLAATLFSWQAIAESERTMPIRIDVQISEDAYNWLAEHHKDLPGYIGNQTKKLFETEYAENLNRQLLEAYRLVRDRGTPAQKLEVINFINGMTFAEKEPPNWR